MFPRLATFTPMESPPRRECQNASHPARTNRAGWQWGTVWRGLSCRRPLCLNAVLLLDPGKQLVGSFDPRADDPDEDRLHDRSEDKCGEGEQDDDERGGSEDVFHGGILRSFFGLNSSDY